MEHVIVVFSDVGQSVDECKERRNSSSFLGIHISMDHYPFEWTLFRIREEMDHIKSKLSEIGFSENILKKEMKQKELKSVSMNVLKKIVCIHHIGLKVNGHFATNKHFSST